jgi:hypothetical protein
MNDAKDANSADSGSRYLRLPWPLVAAALFGILVIVLAAGLFANRYLRPQVGLVPTEVPVAAPAATATSPPATAVPATPVVALARTPLVIGTVTVPTETPGRGALTPTATEALRIGTATPAARPTLDPLLVAEVANGYEQYWQIRSKALLELDKSQLSQAMAGDHLSNITQLIDELAQEKRAIKTDVDHEYSVVQITGDSAQLVDDYISNSLYVDPITRQPLTAPASDELRVLYRLNKFDGKWKVVDSVRAE